MNEIIPTIGLLVYALAAVSIFTILFVTLSKTLKQIPMFDGRGTWVMALAVSLLCMFGLHQTFIEPAAGGTAAAGRPQPWIELCLVPYTALALTILSVLLLLLLRRVRPGQHTKAELPPPPPTIQNPPAGVVKGSPGQESLSWKIKERLKSCQRSKTARSTRSDR